MRYWLIKSEPDVWSWENQVAAGAKGTPWDGVRNHAAKLNLMAMKIGDEGADIPRAISNTLTALLQMVKKLPV